MGSLTDARIADWQEQAGIKPSTGERARILEALSQAAFDAIKIIELERSGIRDGDGCWHGSDVIGGMTGDLVRMCEQLSTHDRTEWERQQAEWKKNTPSGERTNPVLMAAIKQGSKLRSRDLAKEGDAILKRARCDTVTGAKQDRQCRRDIREAATRANAGLASTKKRPANGRTANGPISTKSDAS